MSKIIKVKQSDIENIVKTVLSEQNFDDFDTKIQPEELPQEPDYQSLEDDDQGRKPPKILIGKDKEGHIAVFDTETGEMLGRK